MASVSESTRPVLSQRDQVIGVVFSLWMLVGLFLDGWAHDNNQPESFFSPWHGILYSGFAGAAITAFAVTWRRPGSGPLLGRLPRGHGLTLGALALFGVGAVGDLIWHEVLGIEVGVEALLSPTHLILLTSGMIALSAPLRAAWGSTPRSPESLRSFLVPVFTLGLLTALVGFFLLYSPPSSTMLPARASTAWQEWPTTIPALTRPNYDNSWGSHPSSSRASCSPSLQP